jgi:hypothetical protein
MISLNLLDGLLPVQRKTNFSFFCDRQKNYNDQQRLDSLFEK